MQPATIKNALDMNEEELNELRKEFGVVPFENPKKSFKTIARYAGRNHCFTLHSTKEVRLFREAMASFKKKISVRKDGKSWLAKRVK